MVQDSGKEDGELTWKHSHYKTAGRAAHMIAF